jgi:protoheme IX farnesyltransferase
VKGTVTREKMIRWITIFRDLTKFNISLLATLSAGAAFILARGGSASGILGIALGVLFLSCGSCALNQYQERGTDSRMERTKGRPLPTGKMAPSLALLAASALILLGSAVLYFAAGGLACVLGVFALAWYNGAYLYLKRRTTWAVLPGALIGAVPPIMGWVAGGGHIGDPRLMAVCFFLFLWQIPHFGLLLLERPADYEKAGLPSLAHRLTADQLKRVIFIWILCTAASCLLIPLFLMVNFPLTLLFLLAATFWLVWVAGGLLGPSSCRGGLRYTFSRLNFYVLGVLLMLSLDQCLHSSLPAGGLVSRIFSMGFKSV